jgi:hypothetical protein
LCERNAHFTSAPFDADKEISAEVFIRVDQFKDGYFLAFAKRGNFYLFDTFGSEGTSEIVL